MEEDQLIELIDHDNLEDLSISTHMTRRLENLDDCMKGLNAESQRLLKLRYQDNRKCKEVARLTGDSLDSVYKRLSQIPMMLRDCIKSRIEPSQPTGGIGHETCSVL